MSATEEIARLRHTKPRDLRLRLSVAALSALVVYSWTNGSLVLGDVFSAGRLANLRRFLGEATPYPLHSPEAAEAGTLATLVEWAQGLLSSGGAEAMATTLALSVAAILAATIIGIAATLPAARTVTTAEPFLPSGRAPHRTVEFGFRCVVAMTRLCLIFVRAIPEYVWAFLFVQIFGFGPWPAVLALALHNGGILGKLMAETVENADPRAPAALRALGAGRGQIAATALLPEALPRLLMYFFYRWETCVREATVLGMLGIVSLGALIRDARAAGFYDEMIFYVLLGAALVMAGDIVSALARRTVRRAG